MKFLVVISLFIMLGCGNPWGSNSLDTLPKAMPETYEKSCEWLLNQTHILHPEAVWKSIEHWPSIKARWVIRCLLGLETER